MRRGPRFAGRGHAYPVKRLNYQRPAFPEEVTKEASIDRFLKTLRFVLLSINLANNWK